MKIIVCVLAAVVSTATAIISQPLGCSNPEICAPKEITYCPRKNPIPQCSSCCCDSSENLEFYNPNVPEPWCSAPPAIYTVRFVGTWTGTCQPDYYPSDAHWSPPTGASHNTQYQMWDACMDNPSPGVALVSQTGSTSVIEQEYVAAGESILDTFIGNVINGGGEVSSDLEINKYYQWVSAVTMLAPSLDRMVGVAGLRLCDGVDWKRSVKVCSELFSTATKSDRVHPPMLRNSVQWNNCSFGYFTFTFKEYQNATQDPPEDCEHDSRDVCPAVEAQPENCRTCCCKSSDNADFYHPEAAYQPECGATSEATYKVSLIPSISSICHPYHPFTDGVTNAYFSDLLLTSHGPAQVFDACVNHIFNNALLYLVKTEEILEFTIQFLARETMEGILNDYYLDSDTLESGSRKRRSALIDVSPQTPFLSFFSKLLPSGLDNQWVGFSAMNLCGPDGWKETVEVCLPLLAAHNTTAFPDAENQLQANNCSFAQAKIELRKPNPLPSPSISCTPMDESVPDVDLSICCYFEFILEGQIIRIAERYGDPYYGYNLLVRVTAVHYDSLEHIEVKDVVTIKVCSLPFRIKFKRIYRLAGTVECGTNEMEISENGVVADAADTGHGEGPCPPYILNGDCDDPR